MVSGVSHAPRAGFHVAKGVGGGAGGEESSDIFDHHQGGSEDGGRVHDVLPQARPGAGCQAGTRAGDRKVLAGESGGENVHGFDRTPVDSAYVTVVGDAEPVPGEHVDGAGVGFGVPGDLTAERGEDAEIQAARTGEEAADPQVSVRHDVPPCGNTYGSERTLRRSVARSPLPGGTIWPAHQGAWGSRAW